jgi:hypothetical protein
MKKPLEQPVIDALREAVAEDGLACVASDIGASPQTLARALAGLEVIGLTDSAIRGYLERRRAAA